MRGSATWRDGGSPSVARATNQVLGLAASVYALASPKGRGGVWPRARHPVRGSGRRERTKPREAAKGAPPKGYRGPGGQRGHAGQPAGPRGAPSRARHPVRGSGRARAYVSRRGWPPDAECPQPSHTARVVVVAAPDGPSGRAAEARASVGAGPAWAGARESRRVRIAAARGARGARESEAALGGVLAVASGRPMTGILTPVQRSGRA